MAEAENELDLKLTKHTPYLALAGELWVVYCENWGGNWTRYNGIALYLVMPCGDVDRCDHWFRLLSLVIYSTLKHYFYQY